jgi:hypothetical protein
MKNPFSRRQVTDAAERVESEPTRPCPFCKEPVSRGATACLHCERDIVPLMPPKDFADRFGPTISLKHQGHE